VTARLRAARALLLAVTVWLSAGNAFGHELDSAALTLSELADGRFRVEWTASSPALFDDLKVPAVFPAPCRFEGAVLDCGARGLSGTIAFPWLEGTRTRVFVSATFRDGSRIARVVTASAPTVNVYGVRTSAGLRSLEPIARDYTLLGVEHILTGFDHLAFVIALMWLVSTMRVLVMTVTAFTLAHSLSLLATVLGIVALPRAPVEVAIALSIVLVCREALSPGPSLARRAPAVVAFAFGLLHGLGFASALLDFGLPENHLTLALFSFNLGVELGQLAVVAAAVGLRSLAVRLRLTHSAFRRAPLYALGGLAAFWFLDRATFLAG
jgi:hydrogenase/urease accessory protein HupE